MIRKLIIRQYSREGISDCTNCTFKDNNKVWGEGNLDGILFLGEAPGKDEDRWQRPFVGLAGKLLDKGLEQAGINRFSHWVSNTISCRPPDNNYAHVRTVQAIGCCKAGLKQEIDYVVSRGVKIIVPLGANACRAVGLEFDRLKEVVGGVYRNSYFEYDDLYIAPNYHPSFILRSGGTSYYKWGAWTDNFRIVKKFLEL